MRGMQGLQDMRASAVEPVRGRENLDVAGRDADGAFAAGQQDFLLGFEPDLGGVELNALPIHGELGGLATSASTAPTAAGRRDVHGHAATGSASASRATTTAHGQRVLRAHFRALLAADLDLALLPHSEVLAHADRGLHGHADVLHVVDADVHHLHHTHVLHVGHAYGLGLEQAHRDVPVLAYLVGLGLANGLAAVLADGDVLVDADILVAVVANADLLVVVHSLRAVVVHGDGLVAVHGLGAVPVDDVGLVAVDGLAPVVAHPFVLVVLDFGELVLLRVQPQLFGARLVLEADGVGVARAVLQARACGTAKGPAHRSEEHTSELQSHSDLVCRLLLEKKNNILVHYTVVDSLSRKPERVLRRAGVQPSRVRGCVSARVYNGFWCCIEVACCQCCQRDPQ